MRRARKLQGSHKATYPNFTPKPCLLLLAIRQALQTPLRPLAPKPALKEATSVDAKGLHPVATTPVESKEREKACVSDCPERDLWVAVLKLAWLDVKSSDNAIRHDALEFFESADFLKILDYAGIDRDLAPGIRAKVRSLKPRTARTLALAA